MNAWIACLTAIGLLAAAYPGAAVRQGPPPARAAISDLAWLAGAWKGETGASVVEEHWTAPAAGAMFAVARTIKGDRTVAFEYLRIVERDGGLVYIAQPGGRPPTDFVLTRISRRNATFENPAHDFPKVIDYTLTPDGTLEARVSGAAAQQPELFRFTRTR